jgi:DNA-binding NarL/FixJ family response regulator
MSLPDMTGIELIQHFKNKHYNSKIITNSYDYIIYDLFQLQKLNVDSILLKDESLEVWKDVIKFNLENKKYYSKTVSEKLERQKANSDNHTLTETEFEILKLLCKGLSTDKIAEQRKVSKNTINSQKKNIFLKFDVHNAVELAVIALKKGYI